MQDRPGSTVLLEAIQDFLMKEVMPFVRENDALSYKTLVSWNMLGVVAREIKSGESKLGDEISRLSRYLGIEQSVSQNLTYQEKMEICKELNIRFSEKIRKEKLSIQDSEAWNLAKKSLEEKIEISNPRFSTGS